MPASHGISIFEHMSGLARQHDAINLGQGFPDFGWPPALLEAASREILTGSNQYAPMRGLPALREAVAAFYRRTQQLAVEPSQVVVTSGATEAIASTILALVEPGDEVVLFEPLYDAYLPLVRRAGGVPRFVTLAPPDWRITRDALAAAIGPRTRMIIFNNPHNPTARLFDADELALLADAAIAADAWLLSDEVWERLVFDGRTFRSAAALPGLAERVIKVGSAGKIFSLTGWKVGWIVAAPDLAERIGQTHQFITFATPPALQAAVAFGLDEGLGEAGAMLADFAASRDQLTGGLKSLGMVPLPAEATYFLDVDLAASGIGMDDVAFCERAVAEAGIAAIPLSPFYAARPIDRVIRLCFAKRAETLEAAISRLGQARKLASP